MYRVNEDQPPAAQDQVILFPGATKAVAPEEPEHDLGVIVEYQADLLARWRALGQELRRRLERGTLPFDLALELRDLIDESEV